MKIKLKKEFSNPLLLIVIILIAITFISAFNNKNNNLNKDSLLSPPEISAINKIVQQEMALQEIVGCAVGVVRNGVIVHVKGYGYLDLEQTKPVTENTQFRWASISKPLTAVAALKAIEDGKLKFADKVKDKLSYWPTDGNKGNITVEHLLNNRGGIAQYSEGGKCKYKISNYTAKNSFNAQQSVNVFKDCSLVNTPGTAYNYSSFGFNLLGAVVEEATDVPYVDYVQKHIANVAGMSNLKAYQNDPGGFDKNCSNELKKVTEGNVEYKLPGGGWSSGIYDLTRFMQGLIAGKFLKNTSALWKPVSNNNGYGFGIMYNTRFNKTQVFHGGTHDDVRTFMGFFPGDKNGVCVIINGGKYVDRVRLYQKIQNASGYTWPESSLSLDFNDGNTACGNLMMGVWRKTSKSDMILRKGYTKDNFYKAWSDLVKLGYHCSDFETYMDGSTRKWSGTFKKGASGSAMWRDFDYNGFKTKWDEMNASGYRLIDIETYVDGSSRKWAGLFIKGTGPYALYRGLNTDDFGNQNKNMSSKGYKLVDIEAYTENNTLKWAGVWQGSGSYLLNRNYDMTPFMDLRKQRISSGWKLTNVESYMVGSTRKWAGIWEKSADAEQFQFNRPCGRLIAYHNNYKEDGFELIDLEKY